MSSFLLATWVFIILCLEQHLKEKSDCLYFANLTNTYIPPYIPLVSRETEDCMEQEVQEEEEVTLEYTYMAEDEAEFFDSLMSEMKDEGIYQQENKVKEPEVFRTKDSERTKIADGLSGKQEWIGKITDIENDWFQLSDGTPEWMQAGQRIHRLQRGMIIRVEVERDAQQTVLNQVDVLEDGIPFDYAIIDDWIQENEMLHESS